MKTNELRLGNILTARGREVEVESIGDNGINYRDQGMNGETWWYPDYKIDDLIPIPLTEEWLFRFGFENLDFPNEFDLNAFCVRRNSKDGIFRYITNDGNVRPIIKHVHQLQNLYFALTGEELTIKQ